MKMLLRQEQSNKDNPIKRESIETPEISGRVKEILEDAIEQKVFPGAVVIAGDKGGKIVEVTAGKTGYLDNFRKVESETIYDIASLTKIFTLTGTLILASNGGIDLDDEIDRLLQNDRFSKITMRQLLAHTAGLRLSLSKLKNFNKERIKLEIFNHGPVTEPGSQYYYSNQGYFILGRVLEEVTKKSLKNFFQESIFNPLGITSTRFNPPIEWRDKIAPTEEDPWRGGLVWGEVHDEIAWKTGGVAGHAGLFSTGEDLFKLGQLWLNNGLFSGEQIIHPDLISQAITYNFSYFSLGWRLGNKRFTGHLTSPETYSFIGFSGPSLMVDPEKELIIVIMNNRIHPSRNGPDRASYHAKVTDEIYRSLFP